MARSQEARLGMCQATNPDTSNLRELHLAALLLPCRQPFPIQSPSSASLIAKTFFGWFSALLPPRNAEHYLSLPLDCQHCYNRSAGHRDLLPSNFLSPNQLDAPLNRNKAVTVERRTVRTTTFRAQLHQFSCINIFKRLIEQCHMLRNLFAMNVSCRNQSGGQVDRLYAEVSCCKIIR